MIQFKLPLQKRSNILFGLISKLYESRQPIASRAVLQLNPNKSDDQAINQQQPMVQYTIESLPIKEMIAYFSGVKAFLDCNLI